MDSLSLEGKTDEELMESYRLGVLEAFEELYRRHAPRVYGFLRKKVGSDDVTDIFQQVFSKLHAGRHKYDATFPFLPWIFTIANHAAIDHLRRLRTRRAVTEDLAVEVQGTPNTAPSAALSSLPERFEGVLSAMEREVLGLRFDGDMSFSEIAKRLNLEAPNVRKISSRAIAKLKNLFVGSAGTARKKEGDA